MYLCVLCELLITGIGSNRCTLNGVLIRHLFSVSNGVRQGGRLSPFLFAGYMDDLSLALNNQAVG